MSSRNDDTTALGAVGGVLAIAGIFFFAVLACIALVYTILALLAWDRPIKIGPLSMTSDYARRYIAWSVTGAIILPVFAAFCEWFLDFQIREKLWFYIVVGGYILGSLAMEMCDEEEKKAAALLPQPPALPQPPLQQLTSPRGLPSPGRPSLSALQAATMRRPADEPVQGHGNLPVLLDLRVSSSPATGLGRCGASAA
jgi:hypothetical protein